MKSKWYSKDVSWFSSKYKKPIAYSTIATSDFITMINQPNRTAKELLTLLQSEVYIHNDEAIMVMQAFINKHLDNEIIITRT